MVASPLPRVLRAAVFTAVCVELSAVAHRLMSGGAIPAWALAAAIAGIFVSSLALLGRTCRFARVAVLMMAGECAQHLLFATAQAHAAAAAGAAAPASMAGMSMPGMSMPGMSGQSMPMGMSHGLGAMFAAHAAAALLCAWWLWHGENAAVDMLWALAVLAMAPPRPADATSSSAAVWLPRRGHAVVATRPTRLGGSVLLVADAVVRRGPPAPAASF